MAEAAARSERVRLAVYVAVGLVLALVLLSTVHHFLFQTYVVPSASMEPLLDVGDRVAVNKLAEPQRGDVVVFDDPGGWIAQAQDEAEHPVAGALSDVGILPPDTGDNLVKRVVGVPGDHVACCTSDDHLTVNGRPVVETGYLEKGARETHTFFEVTVPKRSLFVMGDNRGESTDSRHHLAAGGHTFVPFDHVVGTVAAVVWPAGDVHGVGHTSVFLREAGKPKN